MGLLISRISSPMIAAEEKLGRETVQRLRADLREEIKEEPRRDPEFIAEIDKRYTIDKYEYDSTLSC